MSWGNVKLDECCEKIGSGATPKGGKNVYCEEGVHQIRSQNVRNLEFDYDGLVCITDAAAKKLKSVTVQEGDVLLNITGDSVARTCIVPDEVLPARVNQHVAIVRAKRNALSSEFLSYYLASPYMQSFMLLQAAGKGASRNALTKDMIAGFEIPLPDLETQLRIVQALKVYDSLIENNRKQIKLLEEAAQRLYKEWFIDLRFPGHENTPIIDGLPEGWRIISASDLCDITIGKTPPRKEPKWFSNEGFKWASVADLGKCFAYILQTTECLTSDAIIEHNVKIVPAGSLLLSFKMTVGRVAIASEDMATNEAIAHFYIDDKLRSYLYEYLLNFEFDSLGNTSSISTAINSKIVKTMPIVIPTAQIIASFAEKVDILLFEELILQRKILALREARDRLLPKLMSGEIEV